MVDYLTQRYADEGNMDAELEENDEMGEGDEMDELMDHIEDLDLPNQEEQKEDAEYERCLEVFREEMTNRIEYLLREEPVTEETKTETMEDICAFCTELNFLPTLDDLLDSMAPIKDQVPGHDSYLCDVWRKICFCLYPQRGSDLCKRLDEICRNANVGEDPALEVGMIG